MRMFFLITVLLPSMAYATDWEPLGTTHEANILLDKDSIEKSGDAAKASLRILYHNEQPAQTITHGKPFDSSINRYYVVCSTQRYQVLQLTMLYKNETVGSFNANLNLNDLDKAKLGTGVLLLLNKICPANKPGVATPQK